MQPLDDPERQIRVLRFDDLEAESANELVRCSLATVSLENDQPLHSETVWQDCFTKDVDLRNLILEGRHTGPDSIEARQLELAPSKFRYPWGDYEALSYTWGDGNVDRQILLDNKPARVSENLEAALRALRDLPETRLGMHYFVDWLCIDQENIAEKNHQVKCMGDIYSKARAVVVWLGSEEEGDSIAVQKMYDLYWGDISSNLRPDGYKEIGSFMGKPYWNRAWIIQELGMNRNATLILCGKLKMTRSMVQMGAAYCQQIFWRLQDQDFRNSVSPESYKWWLTSRDNRCLFNLTYNSSRGDGIYSLLNLVRRAEARDARDKVYGILGLLDTSISSLVRPDYSLDVRQVYTRFMASLLTATGNLGYIAFGGIIEDEAWPSWVPDWRTIFERHHYRYLRQSRASVGLPVVMNFPTDKESNLVCEGYKVDVIESLGGHPPEGSTSNTESRNDPQLSKEDASEALWRTLVVDHPGKRKNPSLMDIPWVDDVSSVLGSWAEVVKTNYYSEFHEFRKANVDFLIGNNRLRDLFRGPKIIVLNPDRMIRQLQIAALSIRNRRLASTNKGRFLLVPRATTRGDVVTVLPGCNYPVILRPWKGCYRVVGEAYAHDLMNGEVFSEEFGELIKREEFILC